MSALTDRLMPGCVDLAARRAALLWAAQNIQLEEDGSIAAADKALVVAIHGEFAFNVTDANEFTSLFRKLCELAQDADWITGQADDTLVDHKVLAARGRDEAYKDAQQRNDQEILDTLEEIVPLAPGRGFPADDVVQDRSEVPA